MLERAWRQGKPCTLLVGIYIAAATVENSMEVPQKSKNSPSIRSSNCTPWNISEEKTLIQKEIDTNAHNSIIFGC